MVGCVKHPGASIIGSQILDGDGSHGWQILATRHEPPHGRERKQALITLMKQWKREGGKGAQPMIGASTHRRNANARENAY